jgi:hypothetical protein
MAWWLGTEQRQRGQRRGGGNSGQGRSGGEFSRQNRYVTVETAFVFRVFGEQHRTHRSNSGNNTTPFFNPFISIIFVRFHGTTNDQKTGLPSPSLARSSFSTSVDETSTIL